RWQPAGVFVERQCRNKIALRCAELGLQRDGKARLLQAQPRLAHIYDFGDPFCAGRDRRRGRRSGRAGFLGTGRRDRDVGDNRTLARPAHRRDLGARGPHRHGPSREQAQWRWITWGSVIAAIAWLVVSLLFSWYAENFGSYNKTYG